MNAYSNLVAEKNELPEEASEQLRQLLASYDEATAVRTLPFKGVWQLAFKGRGVVSRPFVLL
jgi:hypothetical protein